MGDRLNEAKSLMEAAAVERYGTSSETAPEAQSMHHADEVLGGMFDPLEAVRIASPGPLACNMCCLQRSQQWLVHHVEPFDVTPARPIDPQYPPVGWFSEESSFLTRCTSFFFPGWRPLTYTLLSGAPPTEELLQHAPFDGSRLVLTHHKGVTCGSSMFTLMAVFTSIPAHWLAMSLLWHLVPVRFPMCCCQPYVITTDGAGRELGRSQFLPDWNVCVPTVEVHSAATVYHLRPDTCLYGMCVRCTCDRPGQRTACWMQTPFHLFHADSGLRVACQRGDAAVADMRDMQEVFSVKGCGHQHVYHTKFPLDAPAAMKATLTGATLLVDLTTFEQDTTTIG